MRLQLALNVSDLDEAVTFYSTMFGTPPAKLRQGYANFVVADPPLKLVLFENPDADGALNHLGVETETGDEVVAAQARLKAGGLDVGDVDDAVCCHADKTETWVAGPDGQSWEWYVVNGDVDMDAPVTVPAPPVSMCCGGAC